MPRYKLTIAYDGTEFCGWQKQFPHADAVPSHMHGFKEGDPAGWEATADIGSAVSSATTPEGDESPQATGGASDSPPRSSSAFDTSTTSDLSLPTSNIDSRPRRELRTVQSVVERAVRQVVREPVIVNGASRTDAGVHARGQVASFLTLESGQGRGGGGWPVDRGTLPLMRAVNARLPDDVLVRSIEVVPDEFNPIMGAVSKGYTYALWCSDHRPLWPRRTAMHFWQRMDVEAMRAAAAEIVGTHDFKAFAAAGHGRLTTVRTVFGCDVLEEGIEGSGDQGIGTEDANAPVAWPRQGGLTGEADGPVQKLVIRVWGNGFLWNMVRIIAGTLVEAGKGRCTPERVREALRTGNRRLAGSTLPAHGLCLEWIRYGEGGACGVVGEE